MKVFINPGHFPGLDSGAVNRTFNLREADITRDIGEKVKFYLIRAGLDAQLLQSDNLMGEGDGDEVCRTANESGADIFVSIHCNSSDNIYAKGTETLVFRRCTKADKLASCIQTQIVLSLDTEDRGIKERPGLAVLKYTDMPAVLVETAFISNATDAYLLMSERDAFARAIARGITDYFRAEGC